MRLVEPVTIAFMAALIVWASVAGDPVPHGASFDGRALSCRGSRVGGTRRFPTGIACVICSPDDSSRINATCTAFFLALGPAGWHTIGGLICCPYSNRESEFFNA